ncbi:hypothetical protein CPT_Mano_006 [Achromobacter phage Mano]|uniref:Uncharacterized protein n=1 Tax=Achromobacter phage Mano TaxID=2767570 RepID=A0A7L8G7P6_9CAUD|nr:hypothetical protein KB680_gp06 [Achromobacter phage Mano]QOE32739.1 hypothetical protein CPT_Mano_006 [Achromobacter phage Mano]
MKTVHLKLSSAIALLGGVVRAGTVVEVDEKLAINLLQRGKAVLATDKDAPTQLRTDGPTVAEYVAAGYLAKNYPPAGYEARSTPEEIQAAIDAEDQAAADADQDQGQGQAGAVPATTEPSATAPQQTADAPAAAKPARNRRGQ